MVVGKTIAPYTEGAVIYVCAPPPITAEDIHLADCWKCPECGQSKELKPWHLPLTFWSVFEREPRMCAVPNSIVFGQYHTEEEAEAARIKYFGADNDNYYVSSHVYKK
jgi:hypothetical protein